MRLRATRIPLTALVTLVSLASVPACSGTSTAPQTSTTTASPTSHGAFGACLREHGVTQLPGPPGAGQPPGPPPQGEPGGTPPPPLGVDQSTWNNAIQACGSLAPAPPGGSH